MTFLRTWLDRFRSVWLPEPPTDHPLTGEERADRPETRADEAARIVAERLGADESSPR